MNKRITVTGANKVFFAFTVLFMVFQVVLMVFVFIYGESFLDENVFSVLLINQYVIILIPVLLYMLINRLNFMEVFRFNRIDLLPVILIVLITILAYIPAMMFNNILVYLMQFIGNVPNQPIPIPRNITELITGIAVVAVSPAICEELLHRGILLKAYEQRGSMKAVFITAIFFGIFHFDVTNLFGATFMGLIIGYFVIRTNSIFAGMLAHFLNNFSYEIIQYFDRNSEPVQKNIFVSLEEIGYLVLFGIFCITAMWFLLKLFKRITEKTAKLKLPISSAKKDVISIITHWPIMIIIILYLVLAGVTFYTLSFK